MNLEKYPMKPNGMYILKGSDFDDIAEEILQENMPHVFYRPQAVDIEYLAEEKFYLDIKYDCIRPDGSVLGMVAFDQTDFRTYDYDGNERKIKLDCGTVMIDMSLIGKENRARRRFTLAHEFAHWNCHLPYHIGGKGCCDMRRTSGLVACRTENIEQYRLRGTKIQHQDEYWLEWQADRLAAAILMPKKTFIEVCQKVMWTYGIRRGYLQRETDKHIASKIIKDVADMFDVSFRATQIRMINLGLVKA